MCFHDKFASNVSILTLDENAAVFNFTQKFANWPYTALSLMENSLCNFYSQSISILETIPVCSCVDDNNYKLKSTCVLTDFLNSVCILIHLDPTTWTSAFSFHVLLKVLLSVVEVASNSILQDWPRLDIVKQSGTPKWQCQ